MEEGDNFACPVFECKYQNRNNSKDALRKHLKSKHAEISAYMKEITKEKSKLKKCSFCEYTYATRKGKILHEKKVHNFKATIENPEKVIQKNQLTLFPVQLQSGCIIVIGQTSNFDQISIQGDLNDFYLWKYLSDLQMIRNGKTSYDMVLADFPWNAQVIRNTGEKLLSYDLMEDDWILDLPIEQVQQQGYLWLWKVNSKLNLALQFVEKHKYEYCDEITWGKINKKGEPEGKLAYYTQNCKENCTWYRKGKNIPNLNRAIIKNLLLAPREGNSEKPIEIYEKAEFVVQYSTCLDLFSRPHNRRKGWVTCGNEVLSDLIPKTQVETAASRSKR